MMEVAAELEYFGGFDRYATDKAEELAGAAAAVAGWSRHLRGKQENPANGDQSRT